MNKLPNTIETSQKEKSEIMQAIDLEIPNSIVKKTIGYCVKCKEIRDAEIIENKGRIFIHVNCPIHGIIIEEFYDNSEFYYDIKRIISSNKKVELDYSKEPISVDIEKHDITTIHINFTERCNLKCKDCFAVCDSEHEPDIEDISIEEIIRQLRPYFNKKNKPMIVIIGGEPTLRPDLPILLKLLHEKGFCVRLSTNGIKLLNKDYFKSLVDVGLDWILLQFDGFDPQTSIDFRGIDLIEKKFKVIKNAQELNVKIHLIMMVSKTVNIEEILKAMDYAFDEPNVYAINLYPVAKTGRFNEDATSPLDVINALEEQSNGSIKKEDFLKSKKFWNRLYKITKQPIFRQKLCTFPMFFIKHKGQIISISKILSIKFFLKHPIYSIRYYFKILKLFKWESKPSKDFIYFNMEKFYDSESLDLQEASDCHNVFLTSKGYIPLCIFNSMYRKEIV